VINLVNYEPLPIIRATGLVGDGSTDNRASLQTQWDDAAALGKALIIDQAGTYMLTATGSGTNRWCLKPGTASIRYALYLAPGVILEVANAQMTNANYGDVIRVTNHTGGGYIGWPFGGRGGKITGNTAGQTGWTNGYVQTVGPHGIGATDTSGQGSRNWTIQGISITDFFSNPINWGSVNDYELGSRDIHADNLYFDTVGEGCQFIGVNRCSMANIEDVGDATCRVGDYCEFAFCTNFTADQLYCHTNGVDGILGGAALDAYASRRGTISNIRAYKTAQGITLQTDFNNSANTADDITVVNAVIKDTYQQAIMPAEGGKSNWTNIVIDNCSHTVSNSVDCASTAAGCRFSMTNVRVINSRSLGVGLGKYNWSNIAIEGGAQTSGYTAIGVSASGELNFHGIKATGYGVGIQFNNCTPTGRISNLDVSGCTVQKLCTAGGVLTSLEVEEDSLHASNGFAQYDVNRTGVTDQQPNQGYTYFYGLASTPIKTIAVGHKNQIMKIYFMFSGGTLQDFRDGGTSGGNIRLAGGVDKAFPQGSWVQLKYDAVQDMRWCEISRSSN